MKKRLWNCLRAIPFLILLFFTWCVVVFHIGVFPPPKLDPAVVARAHEEIAALPPVGTSDTNVRQRWIDKSKMGIHQLVLSGDPYTRGLAEGHYTQKLLYLQEKELVTQLYKFFPGKIFIHAFEILAIRWFWGIDKYFEPWMVEEMAGIAEATSRDFDYLAAPLTRQISYHGLHEVGQMMVDQTGDGMGCTVVALPQKSRSHGEKSWVIGRNFDFEGGRIFDTEKIMKWVFPDQGYAFVSVIWAGMVGAVTGVNEHGLYLSLNAAGSTDFARHGTPSTLVLLKALQFAKTADEAVAIIRKEQMFITDIFVVSDRTTGKLYRVEKSPKFTEVIPLEKPSAVTNHLLGARWQKDRINLFRRDELTSHYRADRGQALVDAPNSLPLELAVLSFLRDKGVDENGNPLHLGNRRAIDALIATHAVIYNEAEQMLFVSQGPGLSGAFSGFDLAASFRTHYPTTIRMLPRDPEVSDSEFTNVRAAAKEEALASSLAVKKKCEAAEAVLMQAYEKFSGSYSYYSTLGDLLACKKDFAGARDAWTKALALSPAYPREERSLRLKIQKYNASALNR